MVFGFGMFAAIVAQVDRAAFAHAIFRVLTHTVLLLRTNPGRLWKETETLRTSRQRARHQLRTHLQS